MGLKTRFVGVERRPVRRSRGMRRVVSGVVALAWCAWPAYAPPPGVVPFEVACAFYPFETPLTAASDGAAAVCVQDLVDSRLLSKKGGHSFGGHVLSPAGIPQDSIMIDARHIAGGAKKMPISEWLTRVLVIELRRCGLQVYSQADQPPAGFAGLRVGGRIPMLEVVMVTPGAAIAERGEGGCDARDVSGSHTAGGAATATDASLVMAAGAGRAHDGDLPRYIGSRWEDVELARGSMVIWSVPWSMPRDWTAEKGEPMRWTASCIPTAGRQLMRGSRLVTAAEVADRPQLDPDVDDPQVPSEHRLHLRHHLDVRVRTPHAVEVERALSLMVRDLMAAVVPEIVAEAERVGLRSIPDPPMANQTQRRE